MEDGGDDAEGVELSSRPASPPTDYEYESSVAEEDSDATRESAQPPSVKRTREIEPSTPDAPEQSSGAKRFRNDEGDTNTAPPTSKQERRKLSAKQRRSKRRISKAQSEHPVSSYAAKPSVVERLPALPPLAGNVDAGELPKSLEGSWVGKRVTHDRDTPWTLEELQQDGFRIVEWDGWWVAVQPPYRILLTCHLAQAEGSSIAKTGSLSLWWADPAIHPGIRPSRTPLQLWQRCRKKVWWRTLFLTSFYLTAAANLSHSR